MKKSPAARVENPGCFEKFPRLCVELRASGSPANSPAFLPRGSTQPGQRSRSTTGILEKAPRIAREGWFGPRLAPRRAGWEVAGNVAVDSQARFKFPPKLCASRRARNPWRFRRLREILLSCLRDNTALGNYPTRELAKLRDPSPPTCSFQPSISRGYRQGSFAYIQPALRGSLRQEYSREPGVAWVISGRRRGNCWESWAGAGG